MANDEHLRILLAAISSTDPSQWNKWRKENPHLVPDLKNADLCGADLRGADLSGSDLRGANLTQAVLIGAKLGGAKFADADLRSSDLTGADLKCAHLQRADLSGANLTDSDLRFADLRGANLTDAWLYNANVEPEALRRAIHATPPDQEPAIARRHLAAANRPPDRSRGSERLKGLIKTGVDRVAKIAPKLFEREDVTTLGLSGAEPAKKNQPATPDPEPHDESG